LLTEVYSAGEAPIIAADTRSLIRSIRVAGKVEPLFVETTDALPEAIMSMAQANDVVIVMGAGSIGQVAEKTRTLANLSVASGAVTTGTSTIEEPQK
jgi:UDP-N-acetylmuramate--alanine ligase